MTVSTSTNQPTRRVRVGWLALGIILALVGGVILAQGLKTTPPEAVPVPDTTFSVAPPSAGPSGSANPGTSAPPQGGEQSPLPDRSTMKPNRLYIPSLGVDAQITQESAPQGRMSIPDAHQVGFYSGGPALNAQEGTSILAGHVSYNNVRGALYDLGKVKPYAVIIVTDGQAQPTYWSVVNLEWREKVSLDSDAVSSLMPSTGDRRIALITCGGELAYDGHHYSYTDNVIAIAAPMPAPSD